MLAVIPQPLRALPDSWRKRVADRRTLSPIDPAADALETAAAELEATITKADDNSRMVSTREFALARGVKDGTVRKWCARGLLAGAQKNAADDWEIPLTATRRRRTRA
jgi:hypothetical protein